MHAQALDYAMHSYARLCTIMHNYVRSCMNMHNAFRRRQKGIANKRDPGTAHLLSFGSKRYTTFFLVLTQWKNFIILQSIFSSGHICRCHLMDRIVHDKHNNELHAKSQAERYAQLCTIIHDYAN